MVSRIVIVFFMLVCDLSDIYAREILLTTGEWEPYISKRYKDYGLVNVIVKEAFKIQNIDVKYKFYPWKRALAYVKCEKNKKYKATTVWIKTKQRNMTFLYSDKPIIKTINTFFYLKNTNFEWKGDLLYLKKFRVGTSLGYSYSQEFENAVNQKILNPDVGLDDLKNLKKLLLKRIDVFICEKNVCLTLMKKYLLKKEQEKITYSKKPLSIEPCYLLFKKNKIQLKKEFDIGFEKFIKSERYQKIVEKFQKGVYDVY